MIVSNIAPYLAINLKSMISHSLPRVSSTRALISRPYSDRQARVYQDGRRGRRGEAASGRSEADGDPVLQTFPPGPPPLHVPCSHRSLVAAVELAPALT